MGKKRLVQHRVARDTSNRETAEIKRENEQLKRQVARLRKQLTNEPEESPEAKPETDTSKPTCPLCSSQKLASVSTPSGQVRYACKSCRQWRGSLSL